MTKKVLIFIIIFIICYEIYLLYSDKSINTTIKNKKINESIKLEQEISPIENNSFTYINEEINKFEDTTELVETVNPMMFGKPTEYEKDNIIIWTMTDPKPWTKIIYKYREKYPFTFYIKIKVSSLNDYSNWKKIINNLNFDPRSGEIIIPCEDEETALSIANLIISNFKGDLTIEEIISKNLIDISINKAKKYDIVKNKLIEQIMINLSNKPKESFNDTYTFTTDLAKHQKNEEYVAYEGTEYSFF